MPKNSTKKNGNEEVKIYTKDELLEIMNRNLANQIKMAEKLVVRYKEYEDATEPDERKIRNSIQTQLNAQYDAINRSCASIIKMNNATLENTKDEENENNGEVKVVKKELVD